MAGLLDQHVLVSAATTWADLAGDVAGFKSLFQHTQDPTLYLAPEADVIAWHGQLAPSGDATHVLFTTAWDLDFPESTQVITTLADEPVDQDYHGVASRTKRPVIELRETCTVTVMGPNKALVRALHVAIHRSLLSKIADFIDAGYSDFGYAGGGDVRPEERMLPAGIYARDQRWTASSSALGIVPGSPVVRKLLVSAWDTTVDGHIGGVTHEGVE